MTHREWIITCLNLHTLLTAASLGQEGTKRLTTLLSHSPGCQIKDLPSAFCICFLPCHSSLQSRSPLSIVPCTFTYILYKFIHTHCAQQYMHTNFHMGSTWFADGRCVTSVGRITSHMREWAAIATHRWKLLLHLPKPHGPKWWREGQSSGDFSIDFSEMTLLPFLWLLLFLRNWQCLLGNRPCMLHSEISHKHLSVMAPWEENVLLPLLLASWNNSTHFVVLWPYQLGLAACRAQWKQNKAQSRTSPIRSFFFSLCKMFPTKVFHE